MASKISVLRNAILAVAIATLLTSSTHHVRAQSDMDLITSRDPRVYNGFEILDPEQKYVLEWTVNWSQRRVHFNVTVQTKGYIGFGLTSDGTMQGADIVMGGVRADGSSYFSDRYGVGNRAPLVDPSQDWTLHSAREARSHTFLSFSRAFDTCDENDHVINEYNTIQLIWSIGETDNTDHYHGPNNRGSYFIYLLDPNVVPRSIKESSFEPGPPSKSVLAQENLQVWTVTTRTRLPVQDTLYHCTVHRGPSLRTKNHIVGFHVRLETPDALRTAHHMNLYRCFPPEDQNPADLFGRFVGTPGESCYFLSQPTGQIPTQYCTQVVGIFAIGQRPTFFPDHLGLPIGERPDEYYVAQVHYDNPNLRADLEFDIHMDVFYQNTLRPNEGGVMTVGHHIPGSPSILIPPSSTAHNIYGHCGSDCTRTIFPPEGINLSLLLLHTHTSGMQIRIRHFRDGREPPWITDDSNYQNTFQQYRVLRNEVNIQQGDHIMIRCINDNRWINGSTVMGGFTTSQEMCLAYFIYYNGLDGYSLCRSEITEQSYMQRYLGVNNITWSNPQLEYVATSPPYLAGQTMTQISNQVNWTPRLRAQLQNDHMYLPQTNACSRSPFSSTGGGQVGGAQDQAVVVRYPVFDREYVPPPSKCGVPLQPKNVKRGRSSSGYRSSSQSWGSSRQIFGGWGNARSGWSSY